MSLRFARLLHFAICLLPVATPLSGQFFYYAPNTAQIPALRQQHDARLSLGLSRFGGNQAIELQGVYSPVNRAAVMLHYSTAGSRDVRQNKELGTHYRFGEIGVGTYEVLPRGSASLFAGLGLGNLHNHYGAEEYAAFNIRRWFVQPGIAYSNESFEAGLALRLTRLVYGKGDVAFAIDEEELNTIQKIERDAPFFLPELGLNAGMRLEPFAIKVHITTVFPNTDGLKFARLNSSMMLSLDLGDLFRGKTKKGEKD